MQTETEGVLAVATALPQPNGAATEVVLPGNLQANYQAPIYARTNGYVRRWYVDIGAKVHKGEVLADIESPEVDQQLRQAQADLGVAQADEKIADVTADRWRSAARHRLGLQAGGRREGERGAGERCAGPALRAPTCCGCSSSPASSASSRRSMASSRPATPT